MENARKFAKISLENHREAEFDIDLGKDDDSCLKIVRAFEEQGCKVEKHNGKPGLITICRKQARNGEG